MNPKRWHQVEQIYNSVLERNPEERNAFLEKACAGDEALWKEVESLLACNGEGAAFIQSPAVEEATKVLAEDSEHRTSLVGRTLLHFSIQVQIGEGGMGVVYKARDNHLNRDVAIKVLPVIFAQDPQGLARFEREARAVAALSHPNILGIYDFCSSGWSNIRGNGAARWGDAAGALERRRVARSQGDRLCDADGAGAGGGARARSRASGPQTGEPISSQRRGGSRFSISDWRS